MPEIIASPGRTLVLPDDLGSISSTRLVFPNKAQMASLDFSLDVSAILNADQAGCVALEVLALGPEDQTYPIFVSQLGVPGAVLSAIIGGGDLYVTYALRYNFTTGGANKALKQYSVDAWLTVANVASFSGDLGAYMSNTGYPTGVGPAGTTGAGVTTAAENSGLVITGNTISFSAANLPTSPDGLQPNMPWNNNGVLSFVPEEDNAFFTA